MIAALAGVVNDHKCANRHEHDCGEDNYKGGLHLRPRYCGAPETASERRRRSGLHQQGAPHYLLPGWGHPHMKRRQFIAFLCVAVSGWPLATLAQVPSKRSLVSGLEVPTAPAVAPATAPVEVPPLPRPRPSLRPPISDNTAALISAFRHQYGEGPVAISPALSRIAQEQANAMAEIGFARSQCIGTILASDQPKPLYAGRREYCLWPC